jgi:hypothetical protein
MMNVMTPPPRTEVKTHATRISLRNRNLDGADAREQFQESAATCEVEIRASRADAVRLCGGEAA